MKSLAARSPRMLFALAVLTGLAVSISPIQWSSADDAGGKKVSAADAERQKALQNPYPNDLGPDTLPKDVLDSYPKEIQEGYKLLRGDGEKKNCQSCHTASRPLNSRFLQPEAKNDPAARKAAVEKLKKEQPDLFKDKTILEVDETIWSRYVKRMMGKPGCNISSADGKKIFEFLVYDSMHRKVGDKAAAWKAHREDLIKQFKEKYPKRYDELKGQNDL